MPGSAGFRARRPRFPSTEEAFAHFAADREARFPLDAAAGPCIDFGHKLDVLLAACAQGQVDRHRHGQFTTYHPACRSCGLRWWAGRVAATALAAVATFGVAVGVVIAVLFSIFYVGGTFSPADRRQVPYAVAAGAAAAVIGAVLWRLGNRWRVPRPLRHVAGYPVDLDGMKGRDMQEWLRDREMLRDAYGLDGEDDE